MDEELREIMTAQFKELLLFETDAEDDDDDGDAELVARFHQCLCEPVDPKTAKYAKAVSRILKGEHASLFTAIEYRDGESLTAGICDIFPSPTRHKEESRRVRAWQTLKVMSRLAFMIVGCEPPRVPTRHEIEVNISQFRAVKKAGPRSGGAAAAGSMQKAFLDKLMEAANALPASSAARMRERLHAIPSHDHGEICAEWSTHPYSTRGVRFGGKALTNDEYDDLVALEGEKWSTAEATFKQLNDLSRVQQHIPSNMLGTIESYASELAGKITAGDADLSNLDLQSIGEDVLRNCSEEDMSQLASNIGQLLPALGGLQKSVEAQSGIATPQIPLEALARAGI